MDECKPLVYGAVFQLCLYCYTVFTMTVAFALVPTPEAAGVRYPGDEEEPLTGAEKSAVAGLGVGEEDAAGAGAVALGKPKRIRRAEKYGKEIDQDTFGARAYLRLAKWGQRTLYAYVLHIAVGR